MRTRAKRSPAAPLPRAMPRPPRRSCWPARVPGGNLQRNGARGRGQLHAGTEHRFPWRKRQVDVHVAAIDAVQRMRGDLDIEIQVAIGPAAHALAALAGHAQLLAVGDAAWNARLHAVRHAPHVAVRIPLERGELEVDLRAVERLVEGEADRGFVVAPGQRHVRGALPPRAAAGTASAAPGQARRRGRTGRCRRTRSPRPRTGAPSPAAGGTPRPAGARRAGRTRRASRGPSASRTPRPSP